MVRCREDDLQYDGTGESDSPSFYGINKRLIKILPGPSLIGSNGLAPHSLEKIYTVKISSQGEEESSGRNGLLYPRGI